MFIQSTVQKRFLIGPQIEAFVQAHRIGLSLCLKLCPFINLYILTQRQPDTCVHTCTYTKAHIPKLIYSHIHKNINMRANIKHAYIQTHKFVHICTYIINWKLSPCSEGCILFWGDSPGSEFYILRFRNTLSVPSSQAVYIYIYTHTYNHICIYIYVPIYINL